MRRELYRGSGGEGGGVREGEELEGGEGGLLERGGTRVKQEGREEEWVHKCGVVPARCP